MILRKLESVEENEISGRIAKVFGEFRMIQGKPRRIEQSLEKFGRALESLREFWRALKSFVWFSVVSESLGRFF